MGGDPVMAQDDVTYKWPPGDNPTVVRTDVMATVDPATDRPVAILGLFDVSGERREIKVPAYTALAMAIQLLRFVEQVQP
jgi:hypothetical protein